MAKVYAHRGASGYAPENTVEAFALAAEQGAHGVELDVHLSGDGELVVAHDETIDRVSDGSGYIANMTLRELKGYNFNRMMPAYPKGTLPTLREVYELLRPTGLYINVELKNTELDYEGMEEKCIALAAEMGMTSRVLYSSFNHCSLMEVKRIAPDAPCGLLYSERLIEPWQYAAEHGMEALHPYFREVLRPGYVRAAHAKNLLVNPWTVNREEDLQRVILSGADIIITNYPDRALSLITALRP